MILANLRPDAESLLARMREAADALCAALEHERTALRNLDMSGLDATSRAKLQALGLLEDCERARTQLCARALTAPDRAGMLALLAGLDDSGALGERWLQITRTLGACRSENRAVGVLLRSSKRSVSEAIALLRGDSHDRELYGPDGHASKAVSGAPLASA